MHIRLRLLLAFAPLLLLACTGGDSNDAPSATPSVAVSASPAPAPAATATAPPAALAPIEPDGDRILGTIEDLASDIGPRIAGTGSEKQAADFIADLLRGYGYDVEVEPFTLSSEVSREATVTLKSPESRVIPSLPFSSSAASTASGVLVSGGMGRPEEIPSQAQGAIVLIERGTLTFQEKVANAEAAGAAGVIIYNNAPGTFFGTLSSLSAIPAVSVSQTEGAALTALAQRSAQIEIAVGEIPVTSSHNVVAKPPGKQCETITGGHYDSVPASPGANDNASGTATVVEIAGVLASQGKMGSHCFVLFGSEEIGLLGSKAYVDSLTTDEKQGIKAMLNFDMVGFGSEPWYLIGSTSMQTKAAEVATGLGIETQIRTLASTGGGSDHASFINAGIPSVFFYRANDPQWHQPGDVAGRMSPALLEEAARMGVAMLESLGAG